MMKQLENTAILTIYKDGSFMVWQDIESETGE